MKPKFGPVASNHGNLKKHRYLPWFKERYAVHAEVNGTDGGGGGGRTGTGTKTGTERAGRQGRNEEGNGEKGRRAQVGRAEGQRRKTEICQ